MKKIALVLLVAVCLVSVLSIGVSAVDANATWVVEGVEYQLPPFIRSMLASFNEIIPTIHTLIDTYVGAFAFAVYGVVAFVFLLIATFGYRLLTFMRGFLGLVAGFLVGFLAWDILITWEGLPPAVNTFIMGPYQVFIRWGAIAVVALLFAGLTVLLRRIGTAASFALVVTICMLPLIRHIFVLIGILAIMFLFSLVKSRASVILLASFGLPTFLLYLIVGPNGYMPFNLEMFVNPTAVDPILIVGVVIGTVISMIHFRVSRKVRA